MVAQSGRKINTNSGNNARKSFDKIRQNSLADDKKGVEGNVTVVEKICAMHLLDARMPDIIIQDKGDEREANAINKQRRECVC